MPPPVAGFVYSYLPGIEAEAAGREANAGCRVLRTDLGALPYLLCESEDDIVLTRPQRVEFLDSLRRAGFTTLPHFQEKAPKGKRSVAGRRPYGTAGPHLARSNVAKYRSDVAVCRSESEIDAAVERFGPVVVIKAEFSSSGQGVRWRWDEATRAWARNRIRQEGCVTVEPWMEIVNEFSGEFLNGCWNGVSVVNVQHGIWRGQWLGDPLLRMSREVYDFVFEQRAIENALRPIHEGPDGPPHGLATWGMDVAVVRRPDTGALELRYLELNGRTNMAHYATAAKKAVPGAQRFDIVRLSDITETMIPLTDPSTASTWCAVLEMAVEDEAGGGTKGEQCAAVSGGGGLAGTGGSGLSRVTATSLVAGLVFVVGAAAAWHRFKPAKAVSVVGASF